MKTLFLPTGEDTAHLAQIIAPNLRIGDVLALSGPLGSGKTFFTRELGKALGSSDSINSPTFVIRNDYDGPLPIRHFDLYRMTREADVEELGLDEDFDRTITVVEWPELAEWILPLTAIRLRFAYRDTGREVHIDGPERILGAL
jgi:tRNA threonylcarbamoyl adenosine modification protein YjeE